MLYEYITFEQLLLFGAGFGASLMALVAFLLRTLPVVGRWRACNDAEVDLSGLSGASIIVYSNEEVYNLEQLLPQLLAQDYAPGFEVIVVNEGESLDVRDLVEHMQLTHRNLYLTHTPDGARNLSRKKLAITLGVKAARYPVAVLTAASARIESTQWLGRMMQHFANEATEVVLGYAAYDPYSTNKFGARTRAFDAAFDAAAWLGDAIWHRPWRGTEYSLAYRRELFFNNKGFSRHLNLRLGDDDIFVSEITNRLNTAVELSDESIVKIEGNNSHTAARERRLQRRFTESFIHRRPRILNALGSWAYLLAFVVPVVGAAINPMNWIGWIACAALLLIAYGVGFVWYRAVRVLSRRRLCVTLPVIAMLRPLRLTWLSIYAKMHHRKRYTWE